MKILTVNTGSSSVRLAAFVCDGEQLTELVSVRHDLGREPRVILEEFAGAHGLMELNVVVHRVVHGGMNLTASRLLDHEVEREIERLAPLAPLHNPTSLSWIRAAGDVFGAEVTQVAVFDTAFFTDLPEAARSYAIPHALTEKHGLRRYGFHGLAHQAMWQAWRRQRPGALQKGQEGKVISIQLGAGCSIAAIDNGSALDTSMGFSPLEGLVMATRSGDIDPGLATFLQRQENLAPEQLDQLLNKRSGLLGISGISADIRALLESTEERAHLAVDMYCYRARKYLGAYLAVLGGADAIIFGGVWAKTCPWCGKEFWPTWNGVGSDWIWKGTAVPMVCRESAVGQVKLRFG